MRPLRWGITIGALLLLLLAVKNPLSSAAGSVGSLLLSKLGAPLWRAGLSVREIFSGDLRTLTARVSRLESERDALIVENARLRDVEQQNQTLNSLLGFKRTSSVVILPARVIAGSNDPDLQTIDLDLGLETGVRQGDAVITGPGIVLGKIFAVSEHSSTVRLLTDARSRVVAAILPPTGAATTVGVVEGGHGLGMVLRYIPESATVSVGDPIVTAGLEAGVPRGLVIGRVESVRREANEPFQTATLSPLVAQDTISVAAVIMAPR